MKTILCFGDSNMWGNIPGSFNFDTGLSGRYSKDKRWTGILQKNLGEDYYIIEDGINARTTNLDEINPGRPYKNGLTLLPISLEKNYPLDLVIFLLGTNDTKIQYNRTAEQIKEGLRTLIKLVKSSNKGINTRPPKILILSPVPIIKIENLHPQLNDESIAKSQQLAAHYKQLAEEEGCAFLDLSQHVIASKIDGVHYDEEQNQHLADAVAEKIKQLI